MDSLIADLRYGVRMLIRTPGLSAVAILTIALGVGLTTFTFSVVYGSIIRGLDFDRGTALASLTDDIPSEGSRGGSIPILDLLDWREQQTAFRGLAGYTGGTVNLADEGSPPERFRGAFVSANLFAQVDGVPILGRVFNPEEDAGSGEQVIILGHGVWQNRYGGDPNIIGRRIQANAESATIVGVMPEGFQFPFTEDVWLPLSIDPVQAQRGANRVQVVGRLREGVSLEQAEVQLGRYSDAIRSAQRAVALTNGRSLSLGILGHIQAVAGDKAAAETTLNDLLARDHVSSYDVALVYAGMGVVDEAFDWLERAYDERSGWLVFLQVEPRFDALRSDERFSALAKRVGLSPPIRDEGDDSLVSHARNTEMRRR